MKLPEGGRGAADQDQEKCAGKEKRFHT
jgi:hypothetical protein